MDYITYVSHSGECPQYGEPVTIQATYIYPKNATNPHEARFMEYATCPILENAKLPEKKQNKKYGLYMFCRMQNDCELLNYPFKKVIDTRYDGYY